MRLLVLCQDPDGPVVRHRIRAILPSLAAEGFEPVRIEGVPKSVVARRRLIRSASEHDLVLVVRKLFAGIDIAPLRVRSPRLAYDFDDAVMLRDPFQGGGRSRTREARFAKMMARVDLVLAGNTDLVARAERLTPERTPVKVAPTPIDTDRFAPGLPRDDVVRVGWIGSRSTRPYLRLIAPALGALVAERPQVRVAVMADRAPEFPFPVEFTPWSEQAEIPFLRSLTVGVMPLTDDPWSRGKCGFKLLQYMACGVPAVASPVGANVVISDDGRAARLADDDEWGTALREVLDDDDAARELGAAGRARAEVRYSARTLGALYAYELAACARGERQ